MISKSAESIVSSAAKAELSRDIITAFYKQGDNKQVTFILRNNNVPKRTAKFSISVFR